MRILIGLIVLFGSLSENLFAVDLGTDQQRAAGKELYGKYCAQCHGESGDGQGPSSAYFKPLPRDFTSGKYKVRTTENGALPTDRDIFLAIKNGLAFKASGAYTVMPPWPQFTDDQLMNLVFHLKTFSADFQDAEYNNPKSIPFGNPPDATEASLKRGREVFEQNECVKCHGNYGRGDGRSAPTLEDDWEQHIRAADLTKRFTFRGNATKQGIFQTVTTGFNGTPMPSYADTVSEEDRWHLVNYIYSLSDRDIPNYNQADRPIALTPVKSAIDLGDFSSAVKFFDGVEIAIIPVVGQVIEPGRALTPGVNEIQVQAIYNEEDVAFLLRWNDMTADQDGANGPDLETPRFEAAVVEESDDPFGDEEEEDPFAEEEDGETVSDAIALQFPSKKLSGFKKPYFLFGDSKAAVDLWFLDLGTGQVSTYTGRGSEDLTKEDSLPLEASSQYQDGEWTVIFKRKRILEERVSFAEEKSFTPVAFSVWDGFNAELGNKRGITGWYTVYHTPKEKPSVIQPMLLYGLGLLLLELLLIFWIRRKHNTQ